MHVVLTHDHLVVVMVAVAAVVVDTILLEGR